MPAFPHQNFRPKLEARYPDLPNARSITRERGNDYRGWALLYRWWVLALLMVKPLLVGGVISRSLRGRIFVLFGPVITNEAHLAFSGAQNTLQQHSRNDCHDGSIVFPWSSWPSGPGCAVVYLSRFHVCYWYVFGHNPSSYTCAASASMSTFYDPCSTHSTAHHATRVRSQWKFR